IEKLTKPLKVKARIRYGSKESEAVISSTDKDLVKVKFNKPQRAITPGQAVVFYNKDKVIGGGWIK
ncbi:MAG: tRNA 2-thiouridine(34) synthase MnmA, partial [Candidatus Omnitrophica bacterium]|nr:tRNA 2-thiouridine(34) synthase MnmA [Candidatus Omnitrophota bacterium]